MPRLIDLDGHLIKITSLNPQSEQWDVPIDQADGVMFQCPSCINKDGHYVICWFKGRVSDDLKPGPGRWTPGGAGIEDLTLVPSVDLTRGSSGCPWHGWVTNGIAE